MSTELSLDLRSSDEKLVSNAMTSTEMLMQSCPNPTQNELRKLLAIQGYMLQQVGLDLIVEARGVKRGDQKLQLALKALAASREALKMVALVSGLDCGSGEER